MTPLTSLPLVLPTLVALVALTGVAVVVVRHGRALRRARRRVVEKPNSHYTSELVRAAEIRHRWHDIDLSRVHEINREEIVRLLARVDALGIESLQPRERSFMEYMAGLDGAKHPAAPDGASRGGGDRDTPSAERPSRTVPRQASADNSP
jgi:hypothetical protein